MFLCWILIMILASSLCQNQWEFWVLPISLWVLSSFFFVSVHLSYDTIECEHTFLNIISAMYRENDKVKAKRPLDRRLRVEELIKSGSMTAFLYGSE